MRRGMVDEEHAALIKGEWIPDPLANWVILEVDGEIVGVARCYRFTEICMDVHIHILPKFWGKKVPTLYMEAFNDWVLATYPQVHKLVAKCPRTCMHPIRAALDAGFEVEAVLPQCSLWRGKIENLVILGKFIKR